VAHDHYTGGQMVGHDNCNVLCIGSRVVGTAIAAELVQAFAGAQFTGEERHVRRLARWTRSSATDFRPTSKGTDMATEATVNERLAAITTAGTSIWLDQIRRSMTRGGELERLVREESLRGETSNPAIFEKAILGAEDYDEQIEQLAHEGADARSIYQAIAIQDVQDAADVLRTVYDETDGYDGYVSLEVDPDIAFDTQRTMEQAREYWGRVDRPNLMIKIPAPTRAACDRADDLRGPEHQHHAAVQGRAVREGDRGLHPRARAPPRGGQVAGRALRGVVLRLARRHRGRQAAGGEWQHDELMGTAGWRTPAPPTSCSSASSTASASRSCLANGAPVPAAAVGVDRA
jgi:hypothetical protein